MKSIVLTLFSLTIVPYVFTQISSSQIITNAINQIQGSFIPISTLFEQTPSADSIRTAIISGNTLSLTKLNQHFLLGKSRLPCADQARYLDQVNGLLSTAIWKNDKYIANLTVDINRAKSLIEFTQKDVNQLNSLIENLRVRQKRANLESFIFSLQQKYEEFNFAADELINLQIDFDQSNEKIKKITNNNTEQRQIANKKRQQLDKINLDISDLQAKLEALNNRRIKVLNQLKLALDIISQTQTQLQALQEKVKLLGREIEKARVKRDILSRQAIRLEQEVAALKKNLAAIQEKQAQFFVQLDQKKSELFELQNMLGKQRSLQELKNINTGFKSLLPQFTSHNYLIYYQCFADRQLLTYQPRDSITEYTIPGNLAQEYLRNIYGKNIGLPSLNFNIDLTLTKIDLFGSSWTNQYQPIFNLTRLDQNTLYFSNDVTCKEIRSSNMPSGVGVITSIEDGNIKVSSYLLGDITLVLGACTRFQATASLPQIGDTIYFKGIRSGTLWNPLSVTAF